MRMLRVYFWETLLGVIIFLLPFVVPQVGSVTNNAEILVTAVSTIFAIVVGFFIADAMANYLRLQTLIALENGTLISLAHAAREISTEHHPKLHDAIDQYMITQLDSDKLNHILLTEAKMREIVKQTDVFIKGSQMDARWEATHEMLKSIHVARQEIGLAAKKNLSGAHWSILAILSCLLMLTILSVRDGSILLNVICGLIMVGSYSILIFLRDLDSNRLLEQKLAFESPIEVFTALDRPPYFPFFAPAEMRKPGPDGTYRLGTKPGSAEPFVIVHAKV